MNKFTIIHGSPNKVRKFKELRIILLLLFSSVTTKEWYSIASEPPRPLRVPSTPGNECTMPFTISYTPFCTNVLKRPLTIVQKENTSHPLGRRTRVFQQVQ